MAQLTASSPITDLPGVGKVRAAAFARIGIFTLRDLVYHFPRSYENRGNVHLLKDGVDGSAGSFLLTVATAPKSVTLKRHMNLTKFRAFDESGTVEIVYFNQPYLKDVFSVGDCFRFYGKLALSRSAVQLPSPKYEKVVEGKALADYVPVYPMTEGLTPKVISEAVDAALAAVLPTLKDPLPESVRLKNKLPGLTRAILWMHRPETARDLSEGARRMAFDECFTFALCAASAKTKKITGAPVLSDLDASPLLSQLPYTLTNAQNRVCQEISSDLSNPSGEAMNRILIGDVGCGKTVCAAFGMYLAVKNGHQAALMAPTEILARQHFEDLSRLFSPLGIRTELLLGSTSAKEKKRIYEGIANGDVRMVIGTHALLSEKVIFQDLALTVTDEQHRFGVFQRAALRNKDSRSHLLVMSATPIPRTLALVSYGDLALSRIDEMPKGRQRVSTFVVDDSYRERMNGFIRKEVESGGQVYIVCPAIEEKVTEAGEVTLEDLIRYESLPELRNATDMYRELSRQVFPDLSVGFLHGKMKAAEKEAAMRAFVEGETKILISTTVIEVGVNVPAASLMIIENAERFGLSQLHQLRGRVGRGTRKSYCILVSDAKSATARKRLETMHTTYDGYEIAEADLKQRGPGDFFAAEGEGFRQSGLPAFRFAALSEDGVMEAAFADAKELLGSDPLLQAPEHAELQNKVGDLLIKNQGTVS